MNNWNSDYTSVANFQKILVSEVSRKESKVKTEKVENIIVRKKTCIPVKRKLKLQNIVQKNCLLQQVFVRHYCVP